MKPADPNWLRGMIGVPYLWAGSDPSGWDCWGLVSWTLPNVFRCPVPGLADPYGPEDYQPTRGGRIRFQSERMTREMGQWREVPKETGAVVAFRIDGQIAHVGVLCGSGRFVHSCDGSETTWDYLNDREWKDRIVGFYLPKR